jgi:hypothetical protein
MLGNWKRKEIFDLCELGCAAALFASPWVLGLADRPAWNLWVCGYAMVTMALADLTCEADWEPRTHLYLGAWLLIAPWILGFSQDVAATFLHLAGGGISSLLSAAELWRSEDTPPRRFQPGAACHGNILPTMDDPNSHQVMKHTGAVRGGVILPGRAHIPAHRRVYGSRSFAGSHRRGDALIGMRGRRRGPPGRRPPPGCYSLQARAAS